MEFNELCAGRWSVRAYKDTPIEGDKLQAVLEAARLAPSACNRQPWIFFVLESDEALEKACACYNREWIRTAPMVILCCVDHSQEWVRPADGKRHGDIDIAIAAEHICLAAAGQGLGTCWICNFDAQKCRELFSLPEELEPAVMLPIGYPVSDEPAPKNRKPLTEIVRTL